MCGAVWALVCSDSGRLLVASISLGFLEATQQSAPPSPPQTPPDNAVCNGPPQPTMTRTWENPSCAFCFLGPNSKGRSVARSHATQRLVPRNSVLIAAGAQPRTARARRQYDPTAPGILRKYAFQSERQGRHRHNRASRRESRYRVFHKA
jgi:hypothetical protein